MKNHAILVETHANVDLLAMVIERLKADNHYFFVHVDKKTKNYKDFLALSSDHVIFPRKRYKVNWGSIEQVLLTLELIYTAESKGIQFDYYHLISGQDYPVVDNASFDMHFENNDKSYFELDTKTPFDARYMFFHLNSLVNVRSRWGQKLERTFAKLQRGGFLKCNLRKSLGLTPYKGSNWWSMTRSMMEYILEFLKRHPDYIERFKYTSCCDEVFFHTIAFNSPLIGSIENDDLRYVDWKRKYPGESLPRVLNEKDYNAIILSNAVFVRKLEVRKSRNLIKMLLWNK